MPEEHVTEIEQDLAALLGIDASPEFAAGVRARVAKTGPSHRWTVWALAAAAVIAGVGGMLMRPANRTAADPPTVNHPGTAVSVGSVPAMTGGPTLLARTSRRPAPRARTRASAEPEVIIDPALAEAVQRLMRAAQQTRREVSAALAEAGAPDLAVVPMVIDELTLPLIRIDEPPFSRSLL